MGRVHAVTAASTAEARVSVLAPGARALDVVLAALLLALALPLMAVLAVAVRRSSHGPVLHREPGFDRRGRPVELLSFRTRVDGAGTVHHGRLRKVVGADATHAETGVGRFMRATRTARLPRLLNVLSGSAGLLAH